MFGFRARGKKTAILEHRVEILTRALQELLYAFEVSRDVRDEVAAARALLGYVRENPAK